MWLILFKEQRLSNTDVLSEKLLHYFIVVEKSDEIYYNNLQIK